MAKINFKSPLTLSILTGIFLGTSIIPFPPWALFFSLSPLFYIWIKETPKKVFLYTTLSFTIGSLISLYWFSYLLNQFAQMPWSASILLTFAIAVFYHIHVAVIGFIYAKWIRNFAAHPILSASTVFAFTWSVFPMVFPWNFSLGWLYGGLEGYQFADIIGSDGISAATIILNGAFLFSFLNFKRTKMPLALSIFSILIFNFAGHFYAKRLPKADKSYKVLIGQANIGNLEKLYMMDKINYKNKVINDYFKVTDEGLAKTPSKPDLIVWPETAFPEYYDKVFSKRFGSIRLKNYITEKDTNLITGVFAQTKTGKTANAAVFFNNKGEPVGKPVYKKILLMFGEYIPGSQYFPILKKWLPMVGDFERGESPQVRAVKNVNLGIQMCYEGLFPWFSRELVSKNAQIFLNLTNDSWYGPYSEPWQHLYLSAFRVIENRIPFIRSTNTGISTVILPDGSFMEKSPIYAQWAGYYEIPYSSQQKKTIYQQWGYAIPLPVILILFIISLIYRKNDEQGKTHLPNEES